MTNPNNSNVQQSSATNRQNTGSILICVIGLLLFLVYVTAIFLFTGIYTPGAICSLVFAIIAFALAFLMPRFSVNKPDAEAVFFGIPMVGFAIYYFFAEIFVSVAFIFFQAVIPFKIVLFIQLVILVAFIIISIVSFTAQRASESKSAERTATATNWAMQSVDVRSIIDQDRARSADPALLSALEHLNDTVTYSDAFGRNYPAIQEVEGRIYATLAQLRDASAQGNDEAEKKVVQQLEALYVERSRKLMLLK